MTEPSRYRFTIYTTEDADRSDFVAQLDTEFKQSLEPGGWSMEIINVLERPEKALENDVFATPMVIRELPGPVVKVLANASSLKALLVAIIGTRRGDDRLI